MSETRFCALPDSLESVMELNAWSKRKLRWTITGGLPGVTLEQLRECYEAAWQGWQDVCGIEAEYTETARSADVLKGSGVIDGRGKTLAWSELPNGSDRPLQQKYDTGEQWVLSLDPASWGQRVPLLVTAAHEIGHALGLGHSPDRRALMYPSLNTATKGRPQEWDVREVQARYGPPKAPPAPQPPPQPPPSPVPAGGVLLRVIPESKVVEIPQGWTARVAQ